MLKLVALKELRLKLTDYTRQVERRGESFLVLRKSRPVFKIVPVQEDSWETLVDFTEINHRGVPLSRVKAAIKNILK